MATLIDAKTNEVLRDFDDALDRLVQVTGPYAQGLAQTTLYYAYNPIGNLTCLDSTASTGCTGGSPCQE